MKNFYRLIPLSLIALLIMSIGPGPSQSDPRAVELLKKVSEKFNSYKSVYAEFSYELYNPDAMVKQETNGRVTIAGNKYRAEYMGITDIFDGHKRYVIVPETQEINVSVPNKEAEELTPARLFDFFKKGYTMKWDIKQVTGGRTIQYVKLFPIKENEIKYVLLGIDAKTHHIYKAIIMQQNGTRITIYIRKFKPNMPVNDNMFRFDKSKYPDYFINELD
ncbi:MAG: outer membrane lipoprotein carrier protein LolA [Chlorobi bacterium]|nr:outer membrane lipoprotein carrier protein LolA [Chlorobiota bacterium]